MESDRKAWIVSLRAIACMSIVLLHVVSTWVEGSQKTVNGMRYYMDLVIIQVLVRWAVPCFVMISGYLLLDISKNIDIRKLCKYIGKMLLVLITIGYLFCIIELVVNGERNASIIVTGLINLISGNSWAHMWYVYMMIGLYIVTPICRHFVAHAGEAEWKYTIVGLFIVCILIPTINDYSGLTITQFLIRNPYIFYYLVGYYLGTHHFLKYWGGDVYVRGWYWNSCWENY